MGKAGVQAFACTRFQNTPFDHHFQFGSGASVPRSPYRGGNSGTTGVAGGSSSRNRSGGCGKGANDVLRTQANSTGPSLPSCLHVALTGGSDPIPSYARTGERATPTPGLSNVR